MAEVLFYHLTESRLDDALPGLLERSLERGWRAVVQSGTEERRDALDQHLWTYAEESFLGHCFEFEDGAADTPVILTTTEANPNGASVRFLVDSAQPGDLSPYVRAIFLFEGHDEGQVEDARRHWRALKAKDHTLTYWQQTPDRRWERKA